MGGTAIPRSHRTSNGSPSAWCISVGCWLESPQRPPKPYSLLPFLLVAHPIAKETTHCVAEHRQTKLELSWKISSYGHSSGRHYVAI